MYIKQVRAGAACCVRRGSCGRSCGTPDSQYRHALQVIIEGFTSYKEQIVAEPFSPKINCIGTAGRGSHSRYTRPPPSCSLHVILLTTSAGTCRLWPPQSVPTAPENQTFSRVRCGKEMRITTGRTGLHPVLLHAITSAAVPPVRPQQSALCSTMPFPALERRSGRSFCTCGSSCALYARSAQVPPPPPATSSTRVSVHAAALHNTGAPCSNAGGRWPRGDVRLRRGGV
jgi:hypothetical protein